MLPADITELAVKSFDEVISKVKNPYNSYALLMAVCLIAASRSAGERSPVRLREVADAFSSRGQRISVKVLAKTLCYASNIIQLDKKFRQSEDYVTKVMEKLRSLPYVTVRIQANGIDQEQYFSEIQKISRELLSEIPPPRRSGKNPFLLAASAVYKASVIISNRFNSPQIFTKVQFSKDVGIAEYTLRSHISTVFDKVKMLDKTAVIAFAQLKGNANAVIIVTSNPNLLQLNHQNA
ncbi:MAG: hypothetical protein LUP94_00165 [Candidatus Methanomethylicus sp.]|nr:hypothetical protein [Candidatus Methanomethylicus sp.]